MRRMPRTLLFGHRLIGPVLAALLLLILLGLVIPSRADAGIRVGVRLATPHVSIVLHSGDGHQGPRICQLPVRRVVVLDRADRRIAGELARRTRYSRAALLDLRRAGYDWGEIGRILDLPPWMVREAVFAGRDDLRGRGRIGRRHAVSGRVGIVLGGTHVGPTHHGGACGR
jgi:hypothetical protein